MLTSLKIENYRGFESLEIKKLARVNLIAGQNNVGKTSLLEAVFLLSGATNPQLILNANVTRISTGAPEHSDYVIDVISKPLFHDLDMNKVIRVAALDKERGKVSLTISRNQSRSVKLPLPDFQRASDQSEDLNSGLLISADDFNDNKIENQIMFLPTGVHVQSLSPQGIIPFPAIILLAHAGFINPTEDASRLGRLRLRKQDRFVLEMLQLIEPKLQSIEDNSASGVPKIWCDIGLPEQLPLEIMGDGMKRIARLSLAIASTPGGVVLVDEIENGVHHTVMPKVWEALMRFAHKADVQIIATTHSYECIQAAYRAVESTSADFHLHRLQKTDDTMRCVTYTDEAFQGAIKFDMEVR